MSEIKNIKNVSSAFSKQSSKFDELYENNVLSDYFRDVFYKEVKSTCGKQPLHILDINCGTGIDAFHYYKQGHSVLGIDNSEGMIEQFKTKIDNLELDAKINAKKLSFENLEELLPQKFDCITSNFGGLNCIQDIDLVLNKLNQLLTDEGGITLAIMPKYSWWEFIQIFKGKFSLAFRRFKKSASANVEGEIFDCYYFNVRQVIKVLKKNFEITSIKSTYLIVPPEHYNHYFQDKPKRLKILSVLKKLENLVSKFPLFRNLGDFYIISAKKRPNN